MTPEEEVAALLVRDPHIKAAVIERVVKPLVDRFAALEAEDREYREGHFICGKCGVDSTLGGDLPKECPVCALRAENERLRAAAQHVIWFADQPESYRDEKLIYAAIAAMNELRAALAERKP